MIAANQRRAGLLGLREILQYRDLLYVLARRDIAVRYRQSALGALWAVLQPLGTMAIWSVIFGRVIRIPSEGLPYPLFAFAGLLPWLFFANTVTTASASVINTPSLITKVYFPRMVIPLAALGAPLLDFLVSSMLMLALCLWYGFLPSPALLALPGLMAIAAMAAIGVGSFFAAMAVSYRDFRHVLPFTVSSWLLLTPVIYPASFVPEAWRPLLYLNPMAGVVEGIRAAWFGLPFNATGLAVSTSVAALMFVIGVWRFRSMERRFADLV
ncbi:MAG TPA: ABC transporter permease [Solimonas sp.]